MNTDYTLRNDGDDLEKYGCEHFNLDRQLNKYEEFWGNYVVPATNRPGNISMRTGIDKDYEKMLIISHGIFRDLLFANIFLKEIDQSNYGIAYLNSHSMILYTGNALQKTNDLINLVDNHKGRKIDRKGRLKIDKPDSKILESFKETQSEDILIFNLLGESEGEKYKNLVSYRNILTHVNTCNIELDLNGNATIPKPKFFKTDYANQTWSRQSYSSEKWGTYKDICNTVYKETIAYINDIYDKIITRLDSIKDREDFIRLRGQIPPQIVQDARGIASGAKGPQGAIIQ